MSKLLGLAVLLMIIWVIARLTVATIGFALHLIWIAAVVMVVVWLIGKLRGK